MVTLEKIIGIIESCREKAPCDLEIRRNEPMASHCTFKTGGPADFWVKPSGEGFPALIMALLAAANVESVPVFFLGGGANILVADKGIRGIVLDIGGWAGEVTFLGKHGQPDQLQFRSGTSLDTAANIAAESGLSGLEFFAGMPGSIGGAVWMNARCYGQETADVLTETEVIDYSAMPPRHLRLTADKAEFGYKKSPFQKGGILILSATFQLTPGKPQEIRAKMDTHRKDREAKGHYRYPSAGSVFKNNQAFGKPTGQIIDELGLRGLQKGGAQIAPWHGNIIVNSGNASAADIRVLIEETATRVKAATGFTLESEVLFVGDW
jgi:UDP-N-acetylmuramate dehydrogenase